MLKLQLKVMCIIDRFLINNTIFILLVCMLTLIIVIDFFMNKIYKHIQ